MLIGCLKNGTAVLEIATAFGLAMTNLLRCCVKSISIISFSFPIAKLEKIGYTVNKIYGYAHFGLEVL